MYGLAPSTMSTLIKDDIGARSRKRSKRQWLSDADKKLRVERGTQIINILKSKPESTVILFSDESLFHVDESASSSSRYISSQLPQDVADSVRFIKHAKYPGGVMVLGVVATDGQVAPPIFIDRGVRLDSATYINLLNKNIRPWATTKFGSNYIFQQDGAPCHTATATQTYLTDNFASFWRKDIWPPNSPDLSPLDYGIWPHMKRKVSAKRHQSVNALKSAIRKEWSRMDATFVRKVCSRFRRRVQAVIDSDGGYIE
jgi:hypothetical protein